MSQVTNQSTAETVRQRLQLIRNHYASSMRSGEDLLRAAMADYAQSCGPMHESERVWLNQPAAA